MCSTCGCDRQDEIRIFRIGKDEKIDEEALMHHHHHHLGHDHTHDHDHGGHHHHHGNGHHHHTHEVKTVVELEKDILQKNNLLAERNRGFLEAKEIKSFNLVSSPGSGKTALLEKTLQDLQDQLKFSVIEGDQQTTNDADRIAATGVPVVQINTGKGCHLDSDMVRQAIKELNPDCGSTLMIENVGNLVCPSLFDLGETARVVIISVTEGDDKPIKYPDMFRSSQLCIINKIDLLPYVNFDIEKAKDYARRINPQIEFIELSATTGAGMEAWYSWLKSQ